jgi:hypothetical protein
MIRLSLIRGRRWIAGIATAALVTACGGLPSTLPIPRPSGGGGTQLTDDQQLKLAAMQRLFNLLDTTPRDGQTVLTTRITKSGGTPRDYALGVVAPAQATLAFSWQFTDPPTNTNASGTVQLDNLAVSGGTVIARQLTPVKIRFAYGRSDVDPGRSDMDDYQNSPRHTVQTYTRAGPDGSVKPYSPNGTDTGSIHIPVVPVTHAIRAAMTLQQDLSVTEASGRTARLGSASPLDVSCKLFRSSQPGATENVAIRISSAPPVVWSANDSPTGVAYTGPGTYVNQHIFMGEGTISGLVVVNPDERSGTISASQPGPIAGIDAVSGRFLCPPRAVEKTLESYS